MPDVGLECIDKYFEKSRYRASQHHIDSFNDFIETRIPAIVKDGNRSFVMLKSDKTPPAEFQVLNLRYVRPTSADGKSAMLPNVARATGESYTLSLYVTVRVEVKDLTRDETHTQEFEDVLLGRIPLMLHNSLCYLSGASRKELLDLGEDPDDPGGYLITWGAEKVIVSQERVAPNSEMVTSQKDANGNKETAVAVRSAMPDNTVMAVTTIAVAKEAQKGAVFVRVPGKFTADVDVAVIFRALGIESDRDIVRHVAPGDDPRDRAVAELLRASLVRCHELKVWSQEEAVRYLGPLTPFGSNRISTRSDREKKRGTTQAMYILRRDMLLGVGESFGPKAVYLGLLVRRALLAHLGMESLTDREALGGKRVFTSGMLLTEIFQEAYTKFKSEATNRLDRAWYYGPWRGSGDVRRVVNKTNATTIFSEETITSVFQSSVRGNWGAHGIPEEGGIVQDLSRLSWLLFLTHLRRTNNPLDRSLKILGPHYLHPTQWGCLCPIDSPDGGNIGLNNHLALTCEVTSSRSPAPVAALLGSLGGEALSVQRSEKSVVVYVNGVPMFMHDAPVLLVAAVREARRKGQIHSHTSVRLDLPRREVRVATDGGRCCRPLLTPAGLGMKKVPDWDAVVKSGRVEYIDVAEADDVMVSWDPSHFDAAVHTHSELHATAGLSMFEATMPFMQHNAGARNVLASQQGKQAAGLYTSAFRSRIDTTGMVLNYPQLPLVTTRYEDTNSQVRHPAGVNTIVAFMTYTGFNMEDAVLVNRSAVERGLFGITYYKNHMEEEDVSGDGDAVRFGNPMGEDALDVNGLPREDAPVAPGDLLIGKVRSRRDEAAVPERGAGGRADENWTGYVTDKVFVYDKRGEEARVHGLKVAKIRYRKLRYPKTGDKLAARHAQKGVIGTLLPESMMPFTRDGIIPDLIINPHALPSRMTLGQVMECLCAKSCAVGGNDRVDGTAFVAPDYDSIRDTLTRHGFDANCNEVMANSKGEVLDADVFIGPTYYQRLKQMVEDKVNYRGARGPRDNVTNQPVGGRARGGGLRMGEMEHWGVLAHGVMGMVSEISGRSDGRGNTWYDGNGAMCVFNEAEDIFRQASADVSDKRFHRRAIPRAFVAMQHEMAGMSLDMRLSVEETEPEVTEHLGKSCGREDPFER